MLLMVMATQLHQNRSEMDPRNSERVNGGPISASLLLLLLYLFLRAQVLKAYLIPPFQFSLQR